MNSNNGKIKTAQVLTFLTLLLQLIQFIFIKKEENMIFGQWELILKIGIGVGGALGAGIPAFIAYLKARKKAKKAKTEEERQAAEIDMTNQMKIFISSAEVMFKQLDFVLKRNGESAGPLKKDTVLSKLTAYAASRNYAFDETYWSGKIDEEVKYTREVNGRQ